MQHHMASSAPGGPGCLAGQLGGGQGAPPLVLRGDAPPVMLMNNGCLCCTVRDDLVGMLRDLVALDHGRGEAERALDAIVIETTGMARPMPVAQALFSDAALADYVALDAFVTVVDAVHVAQQLRRGAEGGGAEGKEEAGNRM